MSYIVRFAHKSILAFILLMIAASGVGPYKVSAQVDTEAAMTRIIVPLQNQPEAENAVRVGPNLLRDPGFEASYRSNQYWTQLPFDTVCVYWDSACIDTGAGYHSGGAWAWFGGIGSNSNHLSQSVTFPKCGADLEFVLYIGRAAPGSGTNDFFEALIDGNQVFRTDATHINSYPVYTRKVIDVSQFADGGVHTVEFHSETPDIYLAYFNLDDVALYPTISPTSGCANVDVKIGGIPRGTIGIPPSSGDRRNYPNVNSGPVLVKSTNNVALVASQRIAYNNGSAWTNFSEFIGLPDKLKSTKYYFPAYDNLHFDSQLRIANVGTSNTRVTVTVGGQLKGTYDLVPGASQHVNYMASSTVGLNGGPVVIQSSGGVNIVASLRVLPKVKNGSYSEIIGLPENQLGTSYIFPWYNSVGLNSQLRVGNAGSADTDVTVTIAGVRMNTFRLRRNGELRLSFPNIDKGPVKVTSSGGVPIVASLRIAYPLSNGTWTNFSEMMGLPESALDTTYIFPWYNNKGLNSQLRVGNLSSSTATVHIYLGGQEVSGSPFTVLPGRSLRRAFAVDDGPVVIQSTGAVKIIASVRLLFNNGSNGISFSEMMGLPESQLDTAYIFPWYNSRTLNSQLRFGVP